MGHSQSPYFFAAESNVISKLSSVFSEQNVVVLKNHNSTVVIAKAVISH